MFCMNCGAGSQRPDAYCTRCGQWLADPKLPASRRRHAKTPAEKMSIMLTFSAINAALALGAAGERPFADVRSVTENTTDLLAEVPRAAGGREPK